jgi:hypothetical protein
LRRKSGGDDKILSYFKSSLKFCINSEYFLKLFTSFWPSLKKEEMLNLKFWLIAAIVASGE